MINNTYCRGMGPVNWALLYGLQCFSEHSSPLPSLEVDESNMKGRAMNRRAGSLTSGRAVAGTLSDTEQVCITADPILTTIHHKI